MNTYNKRTQDDENVLEIVSDSRIVTVSIVALNGSRTLQKSSYKWSVWTDNDNALEYY